MLLLMAVMLMAAVIYTVAVDEPCTDGRPPTEKIVDDILLLRLILLRLTPCRPSRYS